MPLWQISYASMGYVIMANENSILVFSWPFTKLTICVYLNDANQYYDASNESQETATSFSIVGVTLKSSRLIMTAVLRFKW